jgi:hypothetical protein
MPFRRYSGEREHRLDHRQFPAIGGGEGARHGARRRTILLHLGQKEFGRPADRVLARIAAVNNLGSLSLLLDGILDASSWQELLAPLDENPLYGSDRS